MHSSTRRQFLFQSSLTGAVVASGPHVLSAATAANPQEDLVSRMKWMNDPATWKSAGGTITVRSRPKSDFWRKTLLGYITDSGHFLYLPVDGEFTFEARVGGEYSALYDQAGLMVRLDAENWAKCGTELVGDKRYASVVFTRDFSDGSAMADLASTGPVWWRVVRVKDSLETLCSLDGKTYTSVRLGYLPTGRPAQVGIMCAAPSGNGFDAVFDNLKLTATPA